MNFNSLFFPAPTHHYSMTTHYGEMIYIPKDYSMVADPESGELKPQLNVESLKANLEKAEHEDKLIPGTSVDS